MSAITCGNDERNKRLESFPDAAIFSIGISNGGITFLFGVFGLDDDWLSYDVILLFAFGRGDFDIAAGEGLDAGDAGLGLDSFCSGGSVVIESDWLFEAVVGGECLFDLVEFLGKCGHSIAIVIFQNIMKKLLKGDTLSLRPQNFTG
jgi:hypothetical protein